MEVRISDHVLSDRLGKGEFKVLSMDSRHYSVQSIETGEKHDIYKGLCYITPTLAMANRKRRVERAEKIGRPR